MMTSMRIRNFAPLVIAALLACSAAWGDPPARVGRLNLVQGGVSFLAADTDEWIPATVNYPLTAGDCLWTDSSARAEAHVGSTAIRLRSGTEIGFLELDDAQVRIRLAQGQLSLRLRELDPGESFGIDTPAMSVSLLDPGSYRIEVTGSGDARAIAFEGQMEAVVNGRACLVRANQAAFVARLEPQSLRVGWAPAREGWDQWCAERDGREDQLASFQYVPRSMVGCEDLDWYGTWSLTVEYGPVWTPSSLPAGWAPYRYGHWAWVGLWGWTWIDDMPWGFAPFHYGRWALVHGRWVWMPGSRAQRPAYAPAPMRLAEAAANGRSENGPREAPLLNAVSRLVQEWQSGHSQGPKELRNRKPMAQVSREPKAVQKPKWQKVRKKKILRNGKAVWVEEMAPAGD